MKLQPAPKFLVANYRTLPNVTNITVQNFYAGAEVPVRAAGDGAEPAKPGALSRLLKKAEPPAWFAAGGAVLLYADKVNAMPVGALSQTLQQTPMFNLTDVSARSFAEELKIAAGSSPGHYLVVGASGGLAGVAIGSFFFPDMTFTQRVFWFLGGAVVLIVIVAALAHFGVLNEKPAVR